MAKFKTWLASFEKTLPGKLALSFARAFVGVFIVAEASIFTDLVDVVSKHNVPSLNTLEALLVSLGTAAVIAGVRAVQHFFFDQPAA